MAITRFFSLFTASVVLFLAGSPAGAQTRADTWQVPETPPTPWHDQFVGIPLFWTMVVAVGIGIFVYARKMWLLRHPNGT